jgi:glutaredoxin-like protein NrdH
VHREVIVYSTPFCAPCEQLKAYLRSRRVPFTVKDPLMDEAAAVYLESRGLYTTPVLRVGEELLAGFQPAQVDALLGLTSEG